MSERKASEKKSKGGGQDLAKPPFPTQPRPQYFCMSWELLVQHSTKEVLNICSRVPCLHVGLMSSLLAFTFSVCKARLSAEWQRHMLWSQTSLIPITALPSRFLARCVFCFVLFFCLCGIKLTQLQPNSRISGLWGWTDLDSRLCYLLTSESS